MKKAEHWRIGAFELWFWRRLLRVPWTARISNQSILRKSILNIHSKNWRLQTVALEKMIESPLGCKEIKSVSPKGNQSWILIGRTDAEAEAPILWPPDGKSWLIARDTDAGKGWRQEKVMTENGAAGWPHWLDGHEFEQALGNGEGQGSLACCSPWGHKESDTTEHQ